MSRDPVTKTNTFFLIQQIIHRHAVKGYHIAAEVGMNPVTLSKYSGGGEKTPAHLTEKLYNILERGISEEAKNYKPKRYTKRGPGAVSTRSVSRSKGATVVSRAKRKQQKPSSQGAIPEAGTKAGNP
jgi:hypothetical protein